MTDPGENNSAWDDERAMRIVASIRNMLMRPPIEPISSAAIPWERAVAFMPDLAPEAAENGDNNAELASQVQDLTLRLEGLTNRYAERFAALEAAVYTERGTAKSA